MFATMLCAVPWWANALGILFVAVCLILIALVLLQKGRGGGLAAAFGGEGGQSAFGSKTGDVFTWVTIVIVVAFFLVAISLALGYKPASLEDDIGLGSGLNNQDSGQTEPVDDNASEPDATVTEEAADAETVKEDADASASSDDSASKETPEVPEAPKTE